MTMKQAVEFCRACIEMNSVDELEDGIRDIQSMRDWGLTNQEYDWAIETAVRVLKSDGRLDVGDDGRLFDGYGDYV